VTTPRDEVVDYPIVGEYALDIDPIYRELHQHGPIRVRMPFGEVCWLATRYGDVRTVHTDRRFGKELGLLRDIPRLREGGAPKDPSVLASMDPPRHTRLRHLASGRFPPPRIRKLRGRIEGLVTSCSTRWKKPASRPTSSLACRGGCRTSQ
jgi:cytochrome P450